MIELVIPWADVTDDELGEDELESNPSEDVFVLLFSWAAAIKFG